MIPVNDDEEKKKNISGFSLIQKVTLRFNNEL